LTEESEKTIEMGALIAFYPLNKNKWQKNNRAVFSVVYKRL
jgi:hypothetical protein